MVEVFKTNVKSRKLASEITDMLKSQCGFRHVNFDLADRDRILRIESNEVVTDRVIGLLQTKNVKCLVLPD